MPIIGITIENKIAKLNNKDDFIVCANSDYEIEFSFDDEWNDYDVKSAHFVTSSKTLPPVVFTGNKCPVPIISNTSMVSVGVSAGDLRTTTVALISCKKSIICECGEVEQPEPNVYAEIMEAINSGRLQGPQGERGPQGPQGEAGSIKFIPVVELPTEDIDLSSIYLVPISDGKDENKYKEYVYIDGVWEKLGEISIQVDHSEYVKFTDFATKDKFGLVKAGAGLYNNNGTILINPASDSEVTNFTSYYAPLCSSKIPLAVKAGITKNTLTLTDEEKTAASEWLGAIPKVSTTDSLQRIYAINTDGTQILKKCSIDPFNGAMPIYDSGTIRTNAPTRDDHATNKKYVDDTINEKLGVIENGSY